MVLYFMSDAAYTSQFKLHCPHPMSAETAQDQLDEVRKLNQHQHHLIFLNAMLWEEGGHYDLLAVSQQSKFVLILTK